MSREAVTWVNRSARWVVPARRRGSIRFEGLS